MVLLECRWMWEGIEPADSLVCNPHNLSGVEGLHARRVNDSDQA